MFFDERPHRRRARDDPGRRRGRPPRRARQAAADAARGLRRAVRDHERPAGDDPPARSAAARVPAAHRGGDRRGRGGDGVPIRASCADRARELHEFNPMLGLRGCRLAITYPEIAEMQARAIFEAAVEAGKRTGKPVVPEVMVPLVATKPELDLRQGAHRRRWREAVEAETGAKVDYQVGTMIELPRAALRAGEIAETRGVLLVRHQRPDADDVRHLARRRRAASSAPTLARASCRPTRSSRSTRGRRRAGRASASSAAAAPRRASSSASAASTAAIRPRSRSARRSGSTTSPARPSACRSRASPRHRRRSARRPPARPEFEVRGCRGAASAANPRRGSVGTPGVVSLFRVLRFAQPRE